MRGDSGGPAVSIVTVVRNDPEGLARSLDSALSQTVKPEIIVIDGASDDATQHVLEQYRRQVAWCLSEPDSGIYDAMNKGLLRTQGEWIHFLNAGDVFVRPESLERALASLPEQQGEIQVLYADTIVCYSDGSRRFRRAKPIPSVRWDMPFCHQSMLTRRNGGAWRFNTCFRYAADYALVRTIYVTKGENAFWYFSEEPIAIVTSGGVSDIRRLAVIGEYEQAAILSGATVVDRLCFFLRRLREWGALLTRRALPFVLVRLLRPGERMS